jgi:hypothetical protein
MTREEAMESALRQLITSCRECRDEFPVFSTSVPRAEFILWGKLLPPEALGPKCYDHAVKYLGHHVGYRSSQYAVVDLRPVYAALEMEEVVES